MADTTNGAENTGAEGHERQPWFPPMVSRLDGATTDGGAQALFEDTGTGGIAGS